MDGAAPADEDFESLPIEQRLGHKSWKARLSAYTALIALFAKTTDEHDPIFAPYINNPSIIKEWCRDGNAVSQEKGVEAACSFVQWAGTRAARTRGEVVPSVVEKCLGSTRAGTRVKAVELCLLYVEVEEDKAEGVVSDISPGLDVKQPKVVAGCVTVVKEIVRAFGPKTISVKPILALLPKIFAHADKNVRAEGTGLALALHSYLGPALTPHLSELKPVQVKELGEAFAKADEGEDGFGNLKQSRFTRSQQLERERIEAQAAAASQSLTTGLVAEDEGPAQAEEEEVPPSAYDLAEPVSIMSKLPEGFYTHLSSAKWKDRKELALEPLLDLVKTPRLEASDNYDEILRALAGRMTDANVICVALAANCIEAIALGLREAFGRYKSLVLGPMLARTKEKKVNVLDAIGAALDAAFASTQAIGEITEDVTTFGKDKNPSVKQSTLAFYTRCLCTTPSPPARSDLDSLMKMMRKNLEDSNEPVRAAAAECLGTLMKVAGERAMGGKVDELDELRRQRVKDAFEKAVTKYRNGASATGTAPKAVSAAPAPPPAAAAKAKPRPPVAADKENAPLSVPSSAISAFESLASPGPPRPAAKGPPARLLSKKPVVPATSSAPPAAAAAVKKSAPMAAPSAKASTGPSKPAEPLKYKMSQEDAESQVEGGALPAPIIAQLNDSNWKERLAGITALYEWLEGGEISTVESELVVRWLSKKPGWKESNFQVAGKMFSVFQLLAERAPSFAKSSAALSIPALSDKLGDIKLKGPAGATLTAYAEKSSLQFVLSVAYEPMGKQKAPKAQADAMVWVEQAIRDFGIVGLSIRDLIEYLKVGLKSSNAAVRTSATKTLVTLRLYVGVDIVTFLQDLNPQLLTTIEADFAKVANESPPESTRVGADTVVAAAPAGTRAGKGKGGPADGADPLDDMFPRVDFDRLVTSATIAAMNDSLWKIRKEALETIQSTLETNKRLKPSPLSDLSNALKPRLADSNKIVQGLALDVVARIATGMGKPFDRLVRVFAGPSAQVLSDPKAPVRASAVAALTAMADAAGLDTMISSFEKPLDSANPMLRKELLAWLESRLADPDVVASVDLAPIAGATLSCLEDRTAEVRKSATAILPAIVQRTGYSAVMELTSKLKPASRTTIIPLIEAAKANAAAPASNTVPAPRTSSTVPSAPASRAPSAPSSKPVAATAAAASSAPTSGLSRLTGASKTLRTAASSSSLAPLDEPASVPRLGPPRPKVVAKSAAAGPRSSPTLSAVSTTGGKEPPFTNADPKPKTIRAAKETGSLRWVVEGVARPDQVEALLLQMTPNTSPELISQLFSKDHNAERDFVTALTTLDDCTNASNAAQYDLSPEEMRSRLVANIDVIFKYLTVRLPLTSTTITVKCLDLIDHLIPVLDVEGYKLSDYETSALLISLIAKVGDQKETIRNRVRTILQDICKVYPFSKVFSSILENGLSSKNARVRTESAEELGRLFSQHGANAFPVSKSLPQIAKLISDRDAQVRTAALHAVGAVYSHLGAEQTWKLVGPMADKEKSMLEERLKRTTGGGTASGTGSASSSPGRSTTPAGRVGTPSRLSAGERISTVPSPAPATTNGIPRALPKPSVSRLARPASHLNDDATASPRRPVSGLQAPRSVSRPTSSTASSASSSRIPSATHSSSKDDGKVPTMIRDIDTDDLGACSEALKQVQAAIASSADSLIPHADALMDTITRQMSLGFDNLSADTSQAQLRLCKHLMQALSSFFDSRTLGEAVTTPVLTLLLAELTARLLDTAESSASEAISSLSKVLNMVLIRIFHHADPNAVFSALFTVLHDATRDLRDLRGDELDSRAKYAELVMKCLWKVSKTVKESLESRQLRAPRLLRDINDFLDKIPPAQWRRRSSDSVPLADMPLRTVKTILQQVVSVYGERVFDELDEVQGAEESYVYQYLLRLSSTSATSSTGMARVSSEDSRTSQPLKRQASGASVSSINRQEAPASAPGSAVIGRSASNGSTSSTGPSLPAASSPRGGDIEMNQALKQIFDQIGDPAESRKGIAALYEYRKVHPEANPRIAQWMAGTGNYFQSYLQRALNNLAQADEEAAAAAAPAPARVARPPATTPSRGSRLSVGGAGTATTPGQSDRLSQLQGLFGYTDKANGQP